MRDEDSALIKKFLSGDNESFERLILMHRAKALSFAQRYVHDMYTAEDIVQESFADIYVYRERYKEKYSFKTYLFTIIRNKSIDFIRKNKNIIINENMDSVEVSNLEEDFFRKEEINIVRNKVNELKDDYKTVILLIEYYSFTYEEAARIMGKNLGQVKILIYRARQKLRAVLLEDCLETIWELQQDFFSYFYQPLY